MPFDVRSGLPFVHGSQMEADIHPSRYGLSPGVSARFVPPARAPTSSRVHSGVEEKTISSRRGEQMRLVHLTTGFFLSRSLLSEPSELHFVSG